VTSSSISKADYARLKGVSKARVSQWISEGKIDGAALDGDGPKARIRVAIADQQLRERLDIGQRVGNGLATRLGGMPAETSPDLPLDEAPPAVTPMPSAIDKFEEAFKRERLEAIQRENRKRAEEEAARVGRFIDSQAANSEMAKIARKTLTIIDGSLPEIASALAAKFSLPQRDILHLMRAEFRDVCQRAASKLRLAAREQSALIEFDLTKDERRPP
jgi:hypothetical protein